MSQEHLIPEGLTKNDVEMGRVRGRPPLSFIPSKSKETSGESTTVKVKISEFLSESVETFNGSRPEDYVILVNTHKGIARKMNLPALLTAAVKALDDANVAWDIHESLKPTPEEANEVAVEATGSDDEVEDDGRVVTPRKGSGRNAALTKLQEWRQVGLPLKKDQDDAGKTRDRAVSRFFETFENLLGQATSGRWGLIVAKICVGGSTDNETSSDGKSLVRFSLCQHELLLEVFKQDAAEKEREYLLINIRFTYKMSLRAWIQRVEYLSALLEFLPCLADSKNAPTNLERMSKPLSELELCGMIMRAIPTEWVDQYHLLANSELVPMDKSKLLIALEKIETAERNRKRRAQNELERIPKKSRKGDGGGKEKKNSADARGKKERGGGPKHCTLCAKFGGAADTHRTQDCRKWTADGTKKSTFRSKKGGGENKKDFKKLYMQLAKDVGKVLKDKAKKKRKRDDTDDSSSEDD